MTLPSPLLLINAQSQLPNGVDVADGSTVTLALASTAGVYSWEITCIGTDDLNTVAAINATLVVNSANFTATFTAPTDPDGYGAALIFKSTVNNGIDINGLVQPYLTTTAGVYVPTLFLDMRVGAQNETNEGNLIYGWLEKFNTALRNGVFSGGVLFGDVTGPSVTNTISKIQGNPVAAPTPLLNQSLVWNGSAWISQYTATGTAGGDLGGTYPNPQVTGLYNSPLSATPATFGQTLISNGTTLHWSTFTGDVFPSASVMGELTVTGLQTYDVGNIAPTDGYVLTWVTANNRWEPIAITSGSVTLGGDVTGPASSNTVTALWNRPITNAIPPTDGYTLVWNDGAGYWEYLPAAVIFNDDLLGSTGLHQYVVNITGQNGSGEYIVGLGPVNTNADFYMKHNTSTTTGGAYTLYIQGHGIHNGGAVGCGNIFIQGGGDAAANIGPGIVTVKGGDTASISLPGGDVFIQGGDAVSSGTGAEVEISGGRRSANEAGDVKITHRDSGTTTIASFNKNAINLNAFGTGTGSITLTSDQSTTITAAQVFSSNSGYINLTSTFGDFNIDAKTNGLKISQNGVLAATISGIANNNTLTFAATSFAATSTLISTTTSNAAGGNFTVRAQGASGANTGGNLILASGGSLSNANDGYVSLVSGLAATARLTANNTGVITIHNLSTGIVHSDSSGNLTSSLIVNADVSASAAIAYSKLNLSNSIVNADVNTSAAIDVSKLAAGTANQVLINNATPTPAWTTLSGDVTNVLGAMTVGKINGTTVNTAGGSLTTGQVLRVTGIATSDWGALDLGNSSAITGTLPKTNQADQDMGGDVTGTTGSSTVVKLRNTALGTSVGSVGASQDGYVLTWVNGSSEWQPKQPTGGGSTVTWANDLAGSSDTHQYVINLTGSAGVVTTADSVTALSFVSPALTPQDVTISQSVENSSVSTSGKLILKSQSFSSNVFASGNGGDLVLDTGNAGGGGGNAGDVLLKTGTTTRLTVNHTGVITIANLSTGIVHSDSSGNLTSGAVNLATGDVTGTLPTGNQASQTMAGDVSGTTAASSVDKLLGKALNANIGTAGAGQDTYVITWDNASTSYKLLANAGGGSGVTTVGTIDSQSKSANGLVISGVNIYAQTADGTYPGLVSTGTQTIAGDKTLSGATTLSALSTGVVHSGSGGALTSSTIVNTDVSASAAIDVSKLAAGTSAQILLNSSTPTPTWTTVSGDATISNTGSVSVNAIRSATTTINVSSATAPSSGQVLTATSSTTATWQTPSGGGFSPPITLTHTTKTANYTITTSDYVILCDTSGGAFSLTLPTVTTGQSFKIKDVKGTFGTNNLTIVRAGSEKIEGVAASLVLRANWGKYEIFNNGTDWFLL